MGNDKTYRKWREGLMICLACGLAGCATRQATTRVTVGPTVAELVPDSRWEVPLDVTFHVPAGYLAERQRLVIVPRLTVGDSLLAE